LHVNIACCINSSCVLGQIRFSVMGTPAKCGRISERHPSIDGPDQWLVQLYACDRHIQRARIHYYLQNCVGFKPGKKFLMGAECSGGRTGIAAKTRYAFKSLDTIFV
jgi:hypothetical protein